MPRDVGHVRTNTASRSLVPPIHVHINNVPLLPKADTFQATVPRPSTRNLKRSHSALSAEESFDSDDDEEALLLSDVITKLHYKFPRLNLPQYMTLFEQEGIFYAETVTTFTKDFYMDLGFTEGAVRQFLSGVKRSLELEKREKKRVRRQISVELL